MNCSVFWAAILWLISCHALATEMSADDAMFFEGFNAGLMSKYEGEVVDAYNTLVVLQSFKDSEVHRKTYVSQLNAALFAMSFVDRDVKVRPKMLKRLVAISSAEMKAFMGKLKLARAEHGWLAEDAQQEQKIQWVLDRYIDTGNIYGFK